MTWLKTSTAPCIEQGWRARGRPLAAAWALCALAALGGCGNLDLSALTGRRAAPQDDPVLAPAPEPVIDHRPAPVRHGGGASVRPARDATEYQRQMAEAITAANRGLSYSGQVPDVLLAIPVLEVEVNGDGSIRAISVMRKPGQALDTLPLAIEAVRRAGPFPSAAHLPRPWKFSQAFLFNDDRRFKLRALDD